MRSAFTIVFLLVLCTFSFSATIYVPDNYPKIQDAINVSINGDTIIVRPGTYVENIDFVGKAITVQSQTGPRATTIDGGQPTNPDFGSVVTFQNGESFDSVLQGFTLENGSGTEVGVYTRGGGIYCNLASPTVTKNIIVMNSADRGGGIYCYNSTSPAITSNSIMRNLGQDEGGGIYCYSSSPNIISNILTENSAGATGGGIYCSLATSSTISNNTVSGNTAEVSAGIYCYSSSLIIANNIISGNAASYHAGGIRCVGDSSTITNNIIANNTATQYSGGIYLDDSTSIIINNTIYGNTASSGGGIYCYSYSSPVIANTILWANSAPTGPEMWIGSTSRPSALTISYSNVKGGQASVYVEPGCSLDWSVGMIYDNPLFAEPVKNDFHLTWTSPCRDNGDNSAAINQYDFEGDPRVYGGTVDIGADELHNHLYCTGDNVPGGSVDIRVVGTPGIYPVTVGLGSGIQDPPKPTPYGDLYLSFPLDWKSDIGAIPSTGVLVYPETVPPHWLPGQEYPFQAMLGPLASGSKLTNLMLVTVE